MTQQQELSPRTAIFRAVQDLNFVVQRHEEDAAVTQVAYAALWRENVLLREQVARLQDELAATRAMLETAAECAL